MGLPYLGHAAKLQSVVWKRSPVSDFSVSLTIPDTIDAKTFAHQVDQEGRTTNVTYEYEGTNVGEARGFFSSIYAPVQLAFEGDAAIPEDAETEASSEAPVQLEGLEGNTLKGVVL